MRKTAAVLIAAIITLAAAAGVSEEELNDYFPIVDKFTAGRIAEAVADCEKIADRNTPAAVTLYFIYSRGYYDIPIDYPAAARLLSRLDGFVMKSEELRDIWDPMRPPPLNGVDSVVIRNRWNHQNIPVNTTFPLRGKYPLKECYIEKLNSVGGVAARTLIALSHHGENSREITLRMWEKAYELGVPRPGTIRGFSPENRQKLLKPAEAGHVPAILSLCELLTRSEDAGREEIERAFNYLRAAKDICEQSANAGCEHVKPDLDAVNAMFDRIPDLTQSSEQLVAFLHRPHDYSPAITRLTTRVIIDRNDHVAAKYYQALTPETQKNGESRRLMSEAAEAGYPDAIRYLYSNSSADDPIVWHAFYLAGKFDLEPAPNQPKLNYYDRALDALEQNSSIIFTAEYRPALKLLAEHSDKAKARYELLFSDQDNLDDRVKIKVRLPLAADVKWEYIGSSRALVINLLECKQDNYVDLTVSAATDKKTYNILFNPEKGHSDSIWWTVKTADGEIKYNANQQLSLQSPPERIRLYIPAGTKEKNIAVFFKL